MSALADLFDGVMDVVLSPALWLSVAVAAVCGVAFYGWRGGSKRQFGRDVVAALVGFGAGQLAGIYLQLDLLRMGQIRFLAGIAGAVIALFLGRLVWRPGRDST
jgi:uncharacterized membrane protein YjjP (DUF1212 family)